MKLFAALVVLLAASGCDKGETRADNTKNNADKPGVTAQDQPENESDREITQRVRTAVGKDGFSINARNVKIITSNGRVTLRGPVASDKEKTDVAAAAQQTAGVTAVDNQLEVNK
ncbi:MAG: BON domain-containing protein [Polyangiaceae bacterium]|nr:BON domain-containing protein [Polyangiaceae bacterium]